METNINKENKGHIQIMPPTTPPPPPKHPSILNGNKPMQTAGSDCDLNPRGHATRRGSSPAQFGSHTPPHVPGTKRIRPTCLQ